jgi:hypothetical protein
MSYKDDLKDWVLRAIKENGGEATLVQVAKYIWTNHEGDLQKHGDAFYVWQYDMRWAAQYLRNEGLLVGADQAPRGIWRYREPAS